MVQHVGNRRLDWILCFQKGAAETLDPTFPMMQIKPFSLSLSSLQLLLLQSIGISHCEHHPALRCENLV